MVENLCVVEEKRTDNTSKNKIKNKRELKYETIRVIAMLFILILHEIDMFLDRTSTLYYILATILLTGVPCFLMISGKFAFKNVDEDINRYYQKKFRNLIIPILVYMFIKEFHVMGYNLHKEITVYSYIRSLFVSLVNGFSYMEYWFIYQLLSDVLLVPFIRKIHSKCIKERSNYIYFYSFFD